MASLVTEKTLATSIEKAWQIVGDFKSIELWIPTVASCEVTGSGKGMTRSVKLKDGQITIEQCTELDADKYRLQYTIIEPKTIENYLSTLELQPIDDHQCKIVWSCSFDTGAIPEDSVKKALTILYHQSLNKLADYFTH